uniref:Secreted protein n=1 Tax=Poecilia mexicana TaxID=48701 RepID=A0A3B3XMN4_9TELE
MFLSFFFFFLALPDLLNCEVVDSSESAAGSSFCFLTARNRIKPKLMLLLISLHSSDFIFKKLTSMENRLH